ncbi:MAG: hypothetical protein Kow00128_17250 [Deltaproteobacteria bacterium]
MTRAIRSSRFRATLLGALICGAWISAAGAGGSVPEAPFRGRMPGTITLRTLASRYTPVVFDHAAHLEEADGCGACHHRHEPGTAAGCAGCHSQDPPGTGTAVRAARVRPCGHCHPAAPSRSDLSRPGLKAAYHRVCFRCHREVGSVGKDPKGCTEMCHERIPIQEALHEKGPDPSPGAGSR